MYLCFSKLHFKVCGACYEKEQCDYKNGTCPNGCEDGYKGRQCKTGKNEIVHSGLRRMNIHMTFVDTIQIDFIMFLPNFKIMLIFCKLSNPIQKPKRNTCLHVYLNDWDG